jgi:hypothetical protein
MVQEWIGADPDRCGWAPDRDRQLPAAWDGFVVELERSPPAHGLVKLQVTGPLTLAIALERRAAAGRSSLEGLARDISAWLAAAVSDQVRGLRELGLAPLVVVDEPGLVAAQRAGLVAEVWDALRAAAPAWGVHVCGEVPWGLLDVIEPDVISYDLTRSACGCAAQRVIRRLLRRGGWIMWGAVNPSDIEGPAAMIDRVLAAARAVAGRRLRPGDVLGASLLSAACGTGGLHAAAELQIAHDLQVAASLLRGDPPPTARHNADGRAASALLESTRRFVTPNGTWRSLAP